MNLFEFNRGYESLRAFYGGKPNDHVKEVWYEKLKFMSVSAWEQAIDHWIEGEKFMPSISQIKIAARTYMSPVERGETSEIQIPPAEEQFGMVMFPILGEWMSGKITKQSYLGQMRFQARKFHVEHLIAWEEFGDDTPWS